MTTEQEARARDAQAQVETAVDAFRREQDAGGSLFACVQEAINAYALREPARVTDEMVDRAAKAYDDAAVSEGFVSCCGSDTRTRWMRAALEAALLADGEAVSA